MACWAHDNLSTTRRYRDAAVEVERNADRPQGALVLALVSSQRRLPGGFPNPPTVCDAVFGGTRAVMPYLQQNRRGCQPGESDQPSIPFLRARHEERGLISEPMKPREVEVPAVHDVDGASFDR